MPHHKPPNRSRPQGDSRVASAGSEGGSDGLYLIKYTGGWAEDRRVCVFGPSRRADGGRELESGRVRIFFGFSEKFINFP